MTRATTARRGAAPSVVAAALLVAASAAPAKPADISAVGTQTDAKVTGKTLRFSETVRVGRRKIGTDRVTCGPVGGKSATCTAVFYFAGGKVYAKGSVKLAVQRNTIAITGGTGRYAGAKGKLQLRDVSSTATAETFQFA